MAADSLREFRVSPRIVCLCDSGFVGIRVGRYYLSACSSTHRPYFSERNRIRTKVAPLPFGWRLVLRTDA